MVRFCSTALSAPISEWIWFILTMNKTATCIICVFCLGGGACWFNYDIVCIYTIYIYIACFKFPNCFMSISSILVRTSPNWWAAHVEPHGVVHASKGATHFGNPSCNMEKSDFISFQWYNFLGSQIESSTQLSYLNGIVFSAIVLNHLFFPLRNTFFVVRLGLSSILLCSVLFQTPQKLTPLKPRSPLHWLGP